MANVHISNKKVKRSDKEGQGIDKNKYRENYDKIFGKKTVEEQIELAKKNAGRKKKDKIIIAKSDSKNFESESAGVALSQVEEYQKFSDSHNINVKFNKNTGNPIFRTRHDKLKYLKEIGKATGRHYFDKQEISG